MFHAIQEALNGQLRLELQKLSISEPWNIGEKRIIDNGTGVVTSDGSGILLLEAEGPVGPTPSFEAGGQTFCSQPIPTGIIAPSTHFRGQSADGKAVSGVIGSHTWTETITSQVLGKGTFQLREMTVTTPLQKSETTQFYGLLQELEVKDIDATLKSASDALLGNISELLTFDVYGMKATAAVDDRGLAWLIIDGKVPEGHDIHVIAKAFRHATSFMIGDLVRFRSTLLQVGAQQQETITDAPLRPSQEAYLISPLTLRFKNVVASNFVKKMIETLISEPEIPLAPVLTTFWSSKAGAANVRAATLGACIEGLSKRIVKKRGVGSKDKEFSEFKGRLLKHLDGSDISGDPQFKRFIGLLGIGESVPAGELIALAANVLDIKLREKSEEERKKEGKHYPDEIESWKAIRDPAAHGHHKTWTSEESEHFSMAVELFHKLVLGVLGYDCWLNSPHIVVEPKHGTSLMADSTASSVST